MIKTGDRESDGQLERRWRGGRRVLALYVVVAGDAVVVAVVVAIGRRAVAVRGAQLGRWLERRSRVGGGHRGQVSGRACVWWWWWWWWYTGGEVGNVKSGWSRGHVGGLWVWTVEADGRVRGRRVAAVRMVARVVVGGGSCVTRVARGYEVSCAGVEGLARGDYGVGEGWVGVHRVYARPD